MSATGGFIPERRLVMRCLADVEPEAVSWLWKPYIPFGKLTNIEGDPQTGKTFWAIYIAAQITCGISLPDNGDGAQHKTEPRNILYLSAEDGLADTIRPRFDAAHGDVSRFFALEGVIQTNSDGEDVEYTISCESMKDIETAVLEVRPALVVIDPIQAYLGSKVDMYRANQVRPIIQALKKMAEKHDLACLLVRHFGKNTDRSPMSRGLGSVDFAAGVRSILQTGLSPVKPDIKQMFNVDPETHVPGEQVPRFVLCHTKCNIAKPGPTLQYTVGNGYVEILGPVALSPMEALSTCQSRLKPADRAVSLLHAALSQGAKPSAEIMALAAANGISDAALSKGAELLGVKMGPIGYQGVWHWALPTEQVSCPTPAAPTEQVICPAQANESAHEDGESRETAESTGTDKMPASAVGEGRSATEMTAAS